MPWLHQIVSLEVYEYRIVREYENFGVAQLDIEVVGSAEVSGSRHKFSISTLAQILMSTVTAISTEVSNNARKSAEMLLFPKSI